MGNIVAVILFALAVALLASVAQAAPVTADLSWTSPGERVDGTPLAPEDIAEYRVYYSVNGDVDPDSEPVVVTSGNAEVVTIDLAPSPAPYTLAFAVTAVDTEGRESDLSNVEIITALVESTAIPAPPTSLSIEIRCDGQCSVKLIE